MSQPASIRVLIADDHTLVREGLRTIISLQPALELIGEARDGLEAVVMTLTLRPDVLLIDLAMPHKDGLTAIIEIKQKLPQTQILVLTGLADDDHIFPAIKAGAIGYLLKDAPREQLLQAITDVAQGRAYLPPQAIAKIVSGLHQPSSTASNDLTERELDTLRLLAHGLTNEQIAWRLYVSPNTVARHVNSILAKLGLTNRTQAALYALRHGLASLD